MIKRERVATLVAEFLGTGLLTLLVLSVQRSTIGIPYFVALIAALTTVVLVFSLNSASGAILNPAIAIGLWTARKLETLTTIVYVGAELLGAWAAFYLFKYFINTKLTFVGGHFLGRTLVAEAVGAGILGFAWGAVSYKKWSSNIKAPVIGIATMIGMIAASSAAIGLINPGLALGIRAWVWGTYVAGPVIGAIIGINLFGLLFTSDDELKQSRKDAVALFRNLNTSTASSVSKSAPKKASKSAPKRKSTTKKK